MATVAASPADLLAEVIKPGVESAQEDPWDVSVQIHFLCLRAAWESRIGETKRSKVYLDALFRYGDKLGEQPCTSGVHTVSLAQ